MAFQQIMLILWLLTGLSFCVFTIKNSGPMSFIVFVFYTALGPGGWINLGLIGLLRKQFRKQPELITELTFMASILIVIWLITTAFPEIFNSM